MWKQKVHKLLALLLAVLLLSQAAAFQTVAFAAESDVTPVLKNGETVIIPANATKEETAGILYEALVVNKDEVSADGLHWEYECQGQTKLGTWGNRSFGSIDGFETQTGTYIKTTYTHPALSENANDSYRVKLNGMDESSAVTIYKYDKNPSSITLNSDASVRLVYNDDLTVNYDAVREAIWNNVIAYTTPALTLADVTIEYHASSKVDKAWMPLEGGKGDIVTYPAMGEGTQKIRVSYAGDNTHFAASAEIEVNVIGRTAAQFNLKEGPYEVGIVYKPDLSYNYDAVNQAIFAAVVESTEPELGLEDLTLSYKLALGVQNVTISWGGSTQYAPNSVTVPVTFTDNRTPSAIEFVADPSVKLVYNDDLTVDYDAVREAIWDKVVAYTTPDLTLADVTIEYHASSKVDKAWMPLEGGKGIIATYPAMTEGTQKIRVSYPGSDVYTGFSAEVSVNVLGRPEVAFELKEGPYEVGMVFNDDQSYNYAAVEQAIFDAVLESTEPELTFDDVTIQYDANPISVDGVSNIWSSLDEGGLNAFGLGKWKIRFSWNGTKDYKDGSFIVEVTVTDNRIVSEIVFKEGATITYNMDANVMKQDILDNVIDWDLSTLPARETLSLDNFVFEYYGTNILDEENNISGVTQNWAPIEGGKVNLLTYPQMGAGEQQVRITYLGNAEYRPAKNVEGSVTVKKATVKVTVNSTSIYHDETVPADFVTTDPADKFDIYTIYAGLTSSVEACVYVQFPARFTNSAFLKVLDPIVAAFNDGKSLSDIMQEGTTIGELRELLNTQELLDALDMLNIDTGTFGQILSVLNKLPGIADDVRVSFGTPNKAGLYTVYAITDNKNYETGFGMGFLLVKMRIIGVKLEWNQSISKLTVEEAAMADFGATVTYNGEPVADQSNVHYLYSGVTSSLKPYSSTTTAPTEPGRYVVTVVTLGGNYQAAPLTRSFQITK